MREVEQKILGKNGTQNLFELVYDEGVPVQENLRVVNRLRFDHKIKPTPMNTDEIDTAKLQIRKAIDDIIEKNVFIYPEIRQEHGDENLNFYKLNLRSGWTTAICIFKLRFVPQQLSQKFPEFSPEVIKPKAVKWRTEMLQDLIDRKPIPRLSNGICKRRKAVIKRPYPYLAQTKTRSGDLAKLAEQRAESDVVEKDFIFGLLSIDLLRLVNTHIRNSS